MGSSVGEELERLFASTVGPESIFSVGSEKFGVLRPLSSINSRKSIPCSQDAVFIALEMDSGSTPILKAMKDSVDDDPPLGISDLTPTASTRNHLLNLRLIVKRIS